MKKSLKYLSLVIAALFMIAGSTMVAFADDPPAADPVTPDPVIEPDPVTPDPVIEPDPYIEPDPGYDPDDGGNTGYDDGGSGNAGGYTTTDDYYRNTDDPIVYNFDDDGNANLPAGSGEAAGSVTSNTKLYDSTGITEKEAAPNKWSEITLDEKTTTTGVADFTSIKNDTNKDTRHYDWIVYVGYALIGLSVLGILYFIIATAVQRKTDRALEARSRSYSAPARSEAARMSEREYRESRSSAHRTSRFADEATYRPRKVSAKADTDEVYVPRRAKHAK